VTALLLAAFPPELADLPSRPPAGWRLATTGVGAVTAAAETARLVAAERPERALFVGTCGAYDPRLAVGDVIAASAAVAVSQDELEGRAQRPRLERTRWDATWDPGLGLPAHAVAVTPAITLTAEGAARLAAVAAAEHLELTGVFAACHAAGVPVAAVLGVANRVGPQASAEWRANHERVSRRVIEVVGGIWRG
jgi:purine-nucleoside phosphorylase